MLLFFDTETTGKFDFSKDAHDPSQPHIVEIAGLLTDDEGKVQTQFCSLIKPDGWTIGREAAAIHGITQERAEKFGIPIGAAIDVFEEMISNAKIIAAHNIKFDYNMIKRELFALNGQDYEDPFLFKHNVCTMQVSTDICKIPGNYGYKWPKLSEAYEFFFKVPMKNAHSAMGDVMALRKLYFALKNERVL